MKEPRVRFCWQCGKQLRGNYFIEAIVYGFPRILHKICYKNLPKDHKTKGRE